MKYLCNELMKYKDVSSEAQADVEDKKVLTFLKCLCGSASKI